MLGINAKVEDTKSQIIKVINGAELPSCLVDYIMTEILNDVRMSRMKAVQAERESYQKEQQERQGQQEQAVENKPTMPAPRNPAPKGGE